MHAPSLNFLHDVCFHTHQPLTPNSSNQIILAQRYRQKLACRRSIEKIKEIIIQQENFLEVQPANLLTSHKVTQFTAKRTAQPEFIPFFIAKTN